MTSVNLKINNKDYTVEVDESMPLLWVLRDVLHLTGTKYGCGIGQCGACTVHIDETPIRSCLLPISACAGNKITTIEGMENNNPVKMAWNSADVPQCGYCQTGQIMTAIALLKRNPEANEDEMIRAMKGNICRCGTYIRILDALKKAIKINNINHGVE